MATLRRNKVLRAVLASMALAAAPLASAHANLNVFACEPEWGALVKELAGDKADIYVATTGLQDPHRVEARPSLIAKARAADLEVCTGAELEIGWLPMIEQQTANGKIAPGAPGHFEAAALLQLKEIPTAFDRAAGDIHSQGNPHIQADPRNLLAISAPLAQRMAELDPANAAIYAARQADFAKRFTAAIAKWQTEAASLRGTPIVVEHLSWVYLESWLGLVRVAPLEPKPGVPASSGYLASVLDKLKAQPAKFIIRAAYEDDRPSQFVAGRTGLPVATLPFTVGGNDQAKDLFSLYEDTIRRLLAAHGGAPS
ncbi:MAG: zinc ABC transporter substrate-binding protein [Alphaproteobacteria bacterium]